MNKNQMKLRILGVNAAGIKCKLQSFNHILNKLKPQIWSMQETKLKNKEVLNTEATKNYQIYYLNRKTSEGGGLAIGVDKNIESILIREGDDIIEAIVVLVMIATIPVRIIAAYGPQENANNEKKEKFWEFMEEETNKADLENQGLIIQMDGNCHVGNEIIKNDPNKQNNNGKLFVEFLDRNPTLIVANKLKSCQGSITRKRDVQNRTEKAILDFILLNEKMSQFMQQMVIDEKREFCLSNFGQIKKNKRVIETDHNTMFADFDINIPKRKPERIELFNLRNKICQEKFTQETQEDTQLIRCFENELPLEIQSKNWLGIFNSILHKCFRKIRVVKNDKKMDKKDILMLERVDLKNKERSVSIDKDTRVKIENRIKEIELEIGDEIADDYHREILETVNALGGDHHNLNGSGRTELWKLLKRKVPKNAPIIPIGKKDKSGNLVTNFEGLKSLYLKTYINRLRNRPIKSEYEEIKAMKEELFELRLSLAKSNKSDPWTMEDLVSILNELKGGKARDPNGWANELFTNEVAGKSLKISMLKLFNKMKEENYIPEFIQNADITTIYKGKGDKHNLDNDRGIFLVSTFRSILMRLIYRDKYSKIEKNMSDSQVGARRQKSVRNHIWILNGIIQDVLNSKTKKPIDVQLYDYKQCFDSLWLNECLNDLYDSGVQDDQLALLYDINSHVRVAVKTPVGRTIRKSIYNVITQGDNFGPILCSNQVDTIGKECLNEGKYLYRYRGEVEIPPLSMVDDLLCVSECGHQSYMMNAFINYKTSNIKLQFGTDKCKKLHIGKKREEYKCGKMLVDKWTELEVRNDVTNETEIEDTFAGEEEMEEKEEEKYLGEMISSDGKNLKNIKARVSKGKGIVIRIFNILESVPFGKHFFKVGLILRDTLLISSMLYNSEAWYNINNTELDLLETVDLMFLRRLLNAPKSTPKEMLFLELGCIPLRHIIVEKRMGFLHYILNQAKDSIIHKFFQTQMKKPTKSDWVSAVLKDLEVLDIKFDMKQIKMMEKSCFMRIIKEEIRKKVFQHMEELKKHHSKVKDIEHQGIKIQKYLQPNTCLMTKEEAQFIFKLRCRTIKVKRNFKGMFDDMTCTACGLEEETQEHVLVCPKLINNKNKGDINVKYEKLLNGTVSEKLLIAKMFKENYEVLENMKK